MTIYKLSDACAVAGQILPSDVASIAADGFGAVVCNRPDGEEFGQPGASEVAAECETHGVAFHYIPIDRTGLTADMIRKFRDIISNSENPVLAYCRSGQRSSVLWQASGSP